MQVNLHIQSLTAWNYILMCLNFILLSLISLVSYRYNNLNIIFVCARLGFIINIIMLFLIPVSGWMLLLYIVSFSVIFIVMLLVVRSYSTTLQSTRTQLKQQFNGDTEEINKVLKQVYSKLKDCKPKDLNDKETTLYNHYKICNKYITQPSLLVFAIFTILTLLFYKFVIIEDENNKRKYSRKENRK